MASWAPNHREVQRAHPLDEIKQSLERVSARLEIIDSAVYFLPEAVCALSWADKIEDIRFRFVNPAFSKLFGYSTDEIEGSPASLLFGPLTDKRSLSLCLHELASGKVVRNPVVLYTSKGTTIHVIWSAAPMYRAGELIGIVSTHYLKANLA